MLRRALLVQRERGCQLWRQSCLARVQQYQRRTLTTGAPEPKAAADEEKVPDTEPHLLFEGPKASLVRTMKLVSVSNLGFAIVSSPILYYATSAAGAPGKGIAMSALLLTFGGGTTAALTFATKTYVKTMTSHPSSDMLTIVTPTFFGGERVTDIEWSAVQRCSSYHPFATFEADGKIYYLDEGGELDEDAQTRLEKVLSAPEE